MRDPGKAKYRLIPGGALLWAGVPFDLPPFTYLLGNRAGVKSVYNVGEIAMKNRIYDLEESWKERRDEAQPIGAILEELLAQYEQQFPGIRVDAVETEATAM